MDNIAQFLLDKGIGITFARNCKLRIGRTTFDAAYYTQDVQPLPGAMIQEPYTRCGYYVLGNLPASYRYRHAKRYMMNGKPWYIAGYHPAYPLFFILMPDVIGVTDDYNEMVITELPDDGQLPFS